MIGELLNVNNLEYNSLLNINVLFLNFIFYVINFILNNLYRVKIVKSTSHIIGYTPHSPLPLVLQIQCFLIGYNYSLQVICTKTLKSLTINQLYIKLKIFKFNFGKKKKKIKENINEIFYNLN